MLMCMCMLNRRVHTLFDKDRWNKLTKIAKSQNTSVGEWVRKAVDDRMDREKELEQRKRVIDAILKHRPQPFKGIIDYKELINAGRKY